MINNKCMYVYCLSVLMCQCFYSTSLSSLVNINDISFTEAACECNTSVRHEAQRKLLSLSLRLVGICSNLGDDI